MRPRSNYDISIETLSSSRIRLLNAHKEKGSWKRVADDLKLNIRYVWDYAVNGRLSKNLKVQKKLIGRKSINEHLSLDKVQDMPTPLLKYALEFRQEIGCSSDAGTAQEDVTDSPNGMGSMAV